MDNIKDYVDKLAEDLNEMSEEEIIEEIDEALDIEITCTLNGGYKGCCISITLGGPNIYINTRNGMLEGYWGSQEWKKYLNDDVIEAIDEYIEEIYNCSRY